VITISCLDVPAPKAARDITVIDDIDLIKDVRRLLLLPSLRVANATSDLDRSRRTRFAHVHMSNYQMASAVYVVVGLGSIAQGLPPEVPRSAKQGRHASRLSTSTARPTSLSAQLRDLTGVSISFCLNSGMLYRSPRENVWSVVPTFAIQFTDQAQAAQHEPPDVSPMLAACHSNSNGTRDPAVLPFCTFRYTGTLYAQCIWLEMGADQFSLHSLLGQVQEDGLRPGVNAVQYQTNSPLTHYPVSGSRFSKRIGAHDASGPLPLLRCAWKPDAQSARSSNG
jgi:hypothetical protein